MTASILFAWGWSSDVFRIIFPVSVVIGVSAIVLYLLQLVVVTTRLFQAFWASLEDEEGSFGSEPYMKRENALYSLLIGSLERTSEVRLIDWEAEKAPEALFLSGKD